MGSDPDLTVQHTDTASPPHVHALLSAYFEHYAALVRLLARRLQCLATARDLVQEVYFRILRVASDAVIDNPRAFVFQMAVNLTADHRRVEDRRAELLEGIYALLWGADEEISPERQLLASDELAHLDRVLAQVPEQSRLVFVLNRFEFRTQREISNELGMSISTVEKHIRIVLQRLCDARRQYETNPVPRQHATPLITADDARTASSLLTPRVDVVSSG